MEHDAIYDPLLRKIKCKKYNRVDLLKLRKNIKDFLEKEPNNERALLRLKAIESAAVPELEEQYVFMGFCPGGELENRLDDEWISKGICQFKYLESEHQMNRFYNILPGDTVILKKREKFGETMRLYSFGRVTQAIDSKYSGLRYLTIDWITPSHFLEVPLMGCNSTVDVRDIKQVEENMPDEFWDWLATKS